MLSGNAFYDYSFQNQLNVSECLVLRLAYSKR